MAPCSHCVGQSWKRFEKFEGHWAQKRQWVEFEYCPQASVKFWGKQAVCSLILLHEYTEGLYLLIPLKEAPIAYSRPFPFHCTHVGSFNHFLEAFTHYKLSLNIISRDGWCVLHYFRSLCLEITGKHFFPERSMPRCSLLLDCCF